MNIEHLRKLMREGTLYTNKELEDRILKGELLASDVEFLEKNITFARLLQINLMLQGVVPQLNDATMDLQEQINRGASMVEARGLLSIMHWMTDTFGQIKELSDELKLEGMTIIQQPENTPFLFKTGDILKMKVEHEGSDPIRYVVQGITEDSEAYRITCYRNGTLYGPLEGSMMATMYVDSFYETTTDFIPPKGL